MGFRGVLRSVCNSPCMGCWHGGRADATRHLLLTRGHVNCGLRSEVPEWCTVPHCRVPQGREGMSWEGVSNWRVRLVLSGAWSSWTICNSSLRSGAGCIHQGCTCSMDAPARCEDRCSRSFSEVYDAMNAASVAELCPSLALGDVNAGQKCELFQLLDCARGAALISASAPCFMVQDWGRLAV